MAQPPSINDPLADPQLQIYFGRIDDLTGMALSGDIDESSFRDELLRLTIAAAVLMFVLGGGVVGGAGYNAMIAEQTTIARQSVAKLSDDIYSGRYSADKDKDKTADEAREMLRNRLALWAGTIAGVYATGQLNQPARPVTVAPGVSAVVEPSLTWRLGATEQHCTDCASLDGQTMTVSEWKAAGIQPQSPDLECGGWRCDCRLEAA